MSEGPTALSLAAAGLYAFVAFACVLAAHTARSARQPRWHLRTWSLLAVLFVAMIAMRVTMVEEIMRDAARAALRAESAYQSRRELQTVMLAVVAVCGGALGLWLAYRAFTGSRRRRDVAVKVAIAGGLAFGALMLLRLISLHVVDRALYGPLKLNWVGDIGASLIVLGAAAYYAWRLRSLRRAPRR